MLVLSKKENKKSINLIFLILALTLVFNTYFVFSYLYHHTQLDDLQEIQTYTPIYFERFTNLLLSYQLLKEKIINLNANYTQLGLMITDKEYQLDPLKDNSLPFWRGLDIDNYFHERSLEVEKQLATLKVKQKKSFQTMMDFQMLTDSEDFCSNIFGMNVGAQEEKITVTKNIQEKLKKIRASAYQIQIETVIAACNAASEGKLDVVKDLWKKGVDLNLGDYDNRTPLHVACGTGDYDVVEFLVNVAGINVSPVDRWGATPLCDANPYPQIKQLLLSKGAKLGKLQPPYTGVAVQVTDDQFRLFYAAFFGDVKMMENLRLLGWNVNGRDYDGRTALGVAASQGNLEVVKYLLQKGADMNIRDARGNDALDDAIREKRMTTIDYLIDKALVRTYCPKFESGLFFKGLQQTIAVFNKKYEDVKIGLKDTRDPDECRAFLGIHPKFENGKGGPNDTEESPTHRIIEVFTESQELYLYKIIEMQIEKLLSTYQVFVDGYKQVSQSVFFTFIGIQVITLLLLRRLLISKMKDDVLKSRGILNLIPETFFKEHYKEVQKVVQMMKQ